MRLESKMINPVDRYRRWVFLWLCGLVAMVVAMVVVGGLTRLTQSGLSMVEWRPLMGVIPPLGEEAWLEVFGKYKQYPEYRKLNTGMSLEDFKRIFWFEYGHRMLGRSIGLAFLLPFVLFCFLRAIPLSRLPLLLLLFSLGGLQGIIGWWMVKSGLIDRPDVSHYRLALHLGMALLLYVLLLWTALLHRSPTTALPPLRSRAVVGTILLVLGFLTAISGGLVAGLNAGAQFNTFPLMAGQLVPDGLFVRDPWYSNFTENAMTLQFGHRVLAISTALSVALFWFRSGRRLPAPGRRAAGFAALAVALQVALGIATLLSVVWLPLASLHQLGALLLLGSLVWNAHELWRPSPEELPMPPRIG
jgi:heme a synthase